MGRDGEQRVQAVGRAIRIQVRLNPDPSDTGLAFTPFSPSFGRHSPLAQTRTTGTMNYREIASKAA